MKFDINKVVAWTSMGFKATISMAMLGMAGVFGYLSISDELSMLCFGPFAMIFGIFFVISLIWVLDDLRHLFVK